MDEKDEHFDFDILRHEFSLPAILQSLERVDIATADDGKASAVKEVLCTFCNLVVIEDIHLLICDDASCGSIYHTFCLDDAIRSIEPGNLSHAFLL